MADKPPLNPVGPPTILHYSTKNGYSSSPRALIVMAGYKFTPLSVTITNNVHGVLDTAEVSLPISSNPDFSTLLKTQQNDGAVVGSIYIGFPKSTEEVSVGQLERRFLGIIDTISPNFLGDTVNISFRSMGALLEITKHTHTNIGTTTLDFVASAAKSVGLTLKKKLANGRSPATLATVFARDFSVGIQNQRLWDTIVKCAEVDDVDVWVSDGTLNYVDAESITRPKITGNYGYNLLTFDGRHSPQFNKNIKVEVRSYSPKKRAARSSLVTKKADGTTSDPKQTSRVITSRQIFGTAEAISESQSIDPITGDAKTSTTDSTSSGGNVSSGVLNIPRDTSAERYIYYIPYLTAQQCDDRAKTIATQIARNEFTATFKMVPSSSDFKDFTVEALFSIGGVPYARWNTSTEYPYFWPRRMTTYFDGPSESSSSGLTIEVEAINHQAPQQGV